MQDNKSFRLNPQFALVLGGIIIAGLVFVKVIIQAVYAREIKQLANPQIVILAPYQEHVSQSTNALKLAQVGEGLLQKKLPRYAEVNFKRASDLDLNYRDAAYGWAYAILARAEGSLTPDDLVSLHTAIDRAEAVDPLYPPLLKLKLIVAKTENNQDLVTLTQNRLNLLESPQPKN